MFCICIYSLSTVFIQLQIINKVKYGINRIEQGMDRIKQCIYFKNRVYTVTEVYRYGYSVQK